MKAARSVRVPEYGLARTAARAGPAGDICCTAKRAGETGQYLRCPETSVASKGKDPHGTP